jgi:hypothetical protein
VHACLPEGHIDHAPDKDPRRTFDGRARESPSSNAAAHRGRTRG